MKILFDNSVSKIEELKGINVFAGQLITPLTGYRNWGGRFAIDNGSFTKFNEKRFSAILERERENVDNCIFVCAPDVVGNAKMTNELWKRRNKWISAIWPHAYVCQDGCEDLDIPFDQAKCIFIGGTTSWKESSMALDIVKTAKILGLHVHVGRVNTVERFKKFSAAGADTCDGSGIARYDHMLEAIINMGESEQVEFQYEN